MSDYSEEAAILEEKILEKTFFYLSFLPFFFIIPQQIAALFTLKWLGLSTIAASVVTSLAVVAPLPYPRRLQDPYGQVLALYSGRDKVNECLDRLREEIAKSPIQAHYILTHESCTATLRLRRPDYSNHAAADREITSLARFVDLSHFKGSQRIASGVDLSSSVWEADIYASVYCTRSWAGIARWIAKRQISNSS